MDRELVIARLADLRPGRRGFGGTSDPLEAAEVRAAIRGDREVTPDMTQPSAALRAAAVLVPLVDRPGGLTVLLTQRTAHLSAHAGQISFPGGRMEPDDPDADRHRAARDRGRSRPAARTRRAWSGGSTNTSPGPGSRSRRSSASSRRRFRS